jgi:hypothetical protein
MLMQTPKKQLKKQHSGTPMEKFEDDVEMQEI